MEGSTQENAEQEAFEEVAEEEGIMGMALCPVEGCDAPSGRCPNGGTHNGPVEGDDNPNHCPNFRGRYANLAHIAGQTVYGWKSVESGAISQVTVAYSKEALFEMAGFGAVNADEPIRGSLAVPVEIGEGGEWVEAEEREAEKRESR